MKPSSKYYPLHEHLKRCDADTVTLTFQAVEDLLKTTLPASAFKKKAWWSNRDSPSALQASAWVQASFHVQTVDLKQQTVTFKKFQVQYNIQRNDSGVIWNSESIKALRKHMGATQSQFAEQMGVRRQTVSEWENGVYEPDRSTTKHLELMAKQQAF